MVQNKALELSSSKNIYSPSTASEEKVLTMCKRGQRISLTNFPRIVFENLN